MRKDYLSKEDYYMSIAVLSSLRSKDPETQEGACIVNKNHRIVGIGYNGMVNDASDVNMPWNNNGETVQENKDVYVCHAELNAIMNKYAADVQGCSMYVNTFPCNECAKIIVQAGIKEVVHNTLPEDELDKPKYGVAKAIFKMGKVTLRYL